MENQSLSQQIEELQTRLQDLMEQQEKEEEKEEEALRNKRKSRIKEKYGALVLNLCTQLDSCGLTRFEFYVDIDDYQYDFKDAVQCSDPWTLEVVWCDRVETYGFQLSRKD